MRTKQPACVEASTLVVTVSVVATILVLLGSAVGYTQHLSRMSERSRKAATAMEIADGHLETLFTHWRNISRSQVQIAIKKKLVVSAFALPTQYFFTQSYNPGPAPSPDPATTGLTAPPPIIPLPARTNFPSEPNYVVNQYRIQATTPMTELQQDRPDLYPSPSDPEGSTVSVTTQPPAGFGPNTSTTNGQYSYYYLAAADVTVRSVTGNVTAKVRRIFEKKFDQPFTFAMFYIDDLEFHPTRPLKITGPVQTNASLYIGTSNFIAEAPSAAFPTSGKVGFATSYVNGPSPLDPEHSASSATEPTFAPNIPPSMQPPHLPYGWNLNLDATTTNNQSYHELIERPDPTAAVDPIATVRFYNQADYRVLIDGSNNITITDKTGAAVTSGNEFNTITGAITTGTFLDAREGALVRVATLNVQDISKNTTLGMIYISDTSASPTAKRGIRLKKGATIYPAAGLTIVSDNPVYIEGDLNTGIAPPSNSGTYTSPTGTDPRGGSYIWKPVAIVADAITILSNGWSDSTSGPPRTASNTTVNAALVTGNVPSNGSYYSGGGENFIRFLENWDGKSFTYYGSMVQLWQSKQGTGRWSSSSSIYTAPTIRNWFYDPRLATAVPPGNFQLAAYLQQQRWYQVY